MTVPASPMPIANGTAPTSSNPDAQGRDMSGGDRSAQKAEFAHGAGTAAPLLSGGGDLGDSNGED